MSEVPYVVSSHSLDSNCTYITRRVYLLIPSLWSENVQAGSTRELASRTRSARRPLAKICRIPYLS
jgi:hypothetical protein